MFGLRFITCKAVVLKHFTFEPPLTRENTLRPPPVFLIKIEVMVSLTFYSVYFVFFYILFSSFFTRN
jgi:hypothetical protein